SVDKDYEEYAFRVREALKSLPVTIETVLPENATSILEKADAILIGGGNTFKLLHDLYDLNLLDIIRDRVNGGTPYISWSAGSNIVGKTIGTTNDMPIIKPKSFNSLNLFPFQINPHYYSKKIKGFNGETRDQRLEEFIKINPGIPIVCLPEGTGLQLLEGKLKFIGNTSGVLLYQENPSEFKRKEINSKTHLSYLV
ncbi:MAG: dipeptidase PepE, partial [Ginsengibacter sp.]